MSTLLKLLLTFLLTATAHGATAVVGGLRVNADTSNTNTTSVRVTVSGTTNLNSGVLNATNSVNVGVGGTAAGVLTLRSTNATYAIDQTVTNDGTYVVRYGTTNMLTLAVGSGAGWTGTGTNFLADDGTFKFAATTGGDGIWTNDNGTISATSDGVATNTVILVDTDVTHTNGTFMALLNNGTNLFSFDVDGAINIVGTYPQLYMEDVASGDNAYLDHRGNLSATLSGTDVLLFLPDVADGTTVYTFDSLLPHATGDQLVVRNATTNIFTVAAVSGYTGAGTLVLTDDGTYKSVAGAGSVTATSTNTFTNKTFDAAATGNVLTQTRQLPLLRFPDSVDGTGCTYINTNDFTARTFMRPRFSASGATNANFATFSCLVPSDLNTGVELTATIKVALVAGDTDASTYTLGMASVANSASSSPTAANYVTLTIPADGGGGAGDVEGVSNVTLTGWAAAMTPGQWLYLQLQRDGSDASATAEDLLALEITYTSTQ